MNDIYQIQKLVQSGFDFTQIFPDKQQYVSDTSKFDFKLPEVVSFVRQQTDDFKISNPVALDIDKAIVNVINRWSSETGNTNPLTPEVQIVESTTTPATTKVVPDDVNEWNETIKTLEGLIADGLYDSEDIKDEWAETIDALKMLMKEEGFTYGTFKEGGSLGLSGSESEKVFHLPYESAVYVPSTKDVNIVITKDELDQRTNEVKSFLGKLFGGYTSAETVGGFVDSKGNLVNEDVVKVTSFSSEEDFQKNKSVLLDKLSEWSKEWGQEAIGYEFEGDLYYIPESFSSKKDKQPVTRTYFE